MLDDSVVLLSNWLKGAIDPAGGINAILPSVSRRGTDVQPPAIAAVYNEVEDEWIIQGNEPQEVPALIVAANADLSLYSLGGQKGATADSVSRPQPGIAGSPLVLSVSYAIRLTDQVPAVKGAGYTLTAIRRAIALLERASIAQRTLNTTLFLGTHQITERRLLASKGNSALLGVVLAVCTVRDLAP
jgi:hypothetical protein